MYSIVQGQLQQCAQQCSARQRVCKLPSGLVRPVRCPIRVKAEFRPDQQVPPPPEPPQSPFGAQTSANPRFQDMSWKEFKKRYLRPNYLQFSFLFGALTLGLRVSAANYTFDNSPFEYLATAASTGVMCMALAWVLFDFTDSPPPGGNFSSPRK